ncbi:MAG: fibronectin type III domain-containing protein [Chitinophagaceae bacterium]|nr:fibronectin type III domain-containing protein [Chitinophagaceae bacterium]
MKQIICCLLVALASYAGVHSQNVFNPADPIVRYSATAALGSSQRPDPAKPGLQKWVSTPTNGVSTGNDAIDVSSFKQYFLNWQGNPMAFRIKFPRSYTNGDSVNKKYPIMLFLHGAGEVGCTTNNGIYNNEKQLYLGGGLFRDFVNNNQFDGFLLYPQMVNADGCWGSWGTTPTKNLSTAIAMIDSLVKYCRVDNDRVLCNGLSGGGYGAWRIADIFPQRIAKIIPSAAAGSTTNRTNFVHIPIWFATGGKDPDPSPAQADYSLNRMKEIGADIRYTRYPDLGHAVWYKHWREPDYPAAMNETHKANPLCFFQRNEFCANEVIDAKLGLTPGFNAYEWQRNGVTVFARIGTTITVNDTSVVKSYATGGNEINVKQFGTYRVRFRRTSSAAWSVYSPKPVIVKLKTSTVTPPVTVNGTKSVVLPALDGSATVPLQMPAGFAGYEWLRVSDSAVVATSQIYNAPVGTYTGRYFEQFGCGTAYSPNFIVVNADGTPKPAAVTSLTTTPLNQTQVRLNWTQGTGETGFEVYRGTKSGGPYTFVSLRPVNAVTYTDTALAAGTTYYYVMRSVSATGASAKSNESVAKTLADVSAPTAPSNLTYRGSTATSVSLKWTASTDNGSIKRYDIYANNVKVFSTTATSFNVINLDSLTSYTFIVRAIDNNDNVSPPSNQVTGFTHRVGVNYKYYTSTTTWQVLPNFNALTPVKTGITDTIGFNDTRIIGSTITRYGFLWEGLIYIPVAGTYTFETRSDDGTKLYIDVPYSQNATAVVSNDSVHGMRTRTGTKVLTQGYHTFALTYYQGINGLGLELWWSSNVGLARERIPANFLTFTTAAVEPAPALPTGVSATATAYNTIRLNWTDASNNETGFEIVRSSTTSTGTYSPIGIAPANSNSYTDSGLAASKQYFYKIRSVTASSESAFTNFVSATTPAAPTTPIAPSQLDAAGGASNSVSLTWQDNSSNEQGFRVYRSTNGTTFAALGTVGANNNAFTDLTATPQTVYYYYVVGYNAGGEGARSNTVQFEAGNNAPAISALSNMYAKTGQSASQTFTVTDDPGDAVTVKIVRKPAFVSIANIGGSNYRITIDPTNDNVGFHDLVVVATDNNNESSSDTFSIVVADAKTRSVFVTFGPTDKAAPAPWNNWLGNRTAGSTLVNPVDENNVPTPFSIITTGAWTGLTTMGHITGNNSGIVPDVVLQSGLADAGGPKNIRFTGLNPARMYNVEFVASQNEGIRATANYFIGLQVDSIDSRYNTNRSTNLNNLVPDANGILTVTVIRTNSSANTYLNALVLEEYSPADALLNPEHLYAEPTSRTTASLTWSDRTNIENAVDGYEVQRARDSLFTVGATTISLPGNSRMFDDSGLSPNTKYWYRVRAKNDAGVSEYSNKFYVVTPASIVSVNFNSNVVNAPFPWNNLEVNSLNPFVIDNLVNQSGTNSGIKITCTKVFNGEFNAGANTGANTGIVPDAVLMSNFWLDNGQQSQVKLSGLNHTRKYRIGFTGSSSTPGWFKGNYTATYTINGRTVYLNSWLNTIKVVYISDITPDVNGEIFLDFSTTADAQWGFNAGIIIQEYSDANGGTTQYMSNSTIDSTTIIAAPAQDDYKVKVYPNPFSDNINIDFTNPSATGKVSTEIYDLTGRLVYRQNYSSMPAGVNTIRINGIRSAGKGVFIVALKIDGKIVRSVKMLRK